MSMYDYLIVGSGLSGAMFAYTHSHEKCLVIDKRSTIGGNLYCEDINGILVHKYGPHIFHTNRKDVWDFVNLFTEFRPYILQTVANYKGHLYNLPFNMNTFYLLWHTVTPQEATKKILSQIVNIENPKNLEEYVLSVVGTDIYETFIKYYTEKQWGCKCSELSPDIIKRIPIRFLYNNNYFNDKYLGIPINGYNELILGLLKNADILLNTDFFDIKNWRNIAKRLVYTGPIDKFYNYKFGKLKWRSLKFEESILDTDNYLGCAIMNFTDDSPYTRIVEYKHFNNTETLKTVIVKEYPTINGDEPYYPVDDCTINLYSNIHEVDVMFTGRLSEYKYYNMNQIIEKYI